MNPTDHSAYLEFVSRLGPGAKILTERPAPSASPESYAGLYDGVWAHDLASHWTATECSSAVAAFFLALKPRGLLFISIETTGGAPEPGQHRYRPEDFSSLLRQNGFTVIAEGKNQQKTRQIALIAQRI